MGSLGTAGRGARHIMNYLVLCLVLQIGGGHAWCGYMAWMPQPKRPSLTDPHPAVTWEDPQQYIIHDRTLTFLENDEFIMIYFREQLNGTARVTWSPPAGLNLSTGIFTAPTTKTYLVTLTAQIGNTDDKKVFSYAQ